VGGFLFLHDLPHFNQLQFSAAFAIQDLSTSPLPYHRSTLSASSPSRGGKKRPKSHSIVATKVTIVTANRMVTAI